jgi:hypothetical protein
MAEKHRNGSQGKARNNDTGQFREEGKRPKQNPRTGNSTRSMVVAPPNPGPGRHGSLRQEVESKRQTTRRVGELQYRRVGDMVISPFTATGSTAPLRSPETLRANDLGPILVGDEPSPPFGRSGGLARYCQLV